MWTSLVCCSIKSIMESLRLAIASLFGKSCLSCLSVTDESSGAEIKETSSSTLSESVTIKRKIRNKEEFSSEAYGNEDGERRVKQSTEKKLKAKVSSKSEHKSLAKTGLSHVFF